MRHGVASKLAGANKRIGNILRKSGQDINNTIKEDVFIIEEEVLLFEEVRRISDDLDRLYKKADYTAALTLLAGLSESIEAFFDKVMVMDDNPVVRLNRLNLLAELKGLFDRIANLALLG